jgi:cytochrome c553
MSAMQRKAAAVFYIQFRRVKEVFIFATPRAEGMLLSSSSKLTRRNEIMKTTKLVMLVTTIAVALFMLIPNLSWAADDGAATFKAKCAMCHGADGAGKPAMKAPSLISDEAKKKSDDDFAKAINETAKHTPAVKSLPADDVKAVIAYIRTLQK